MKKNISTIIKEELDLEREKQIYEENFEKLKKYAIGKEIKIKGKKVTYHENSFQFDLTSKIENIIGNFYFDKDKMGNKRFRWSLSFHLGRPEGLIVSKNGNIEIETLTVDEFLRFYNKEMFIDIFDDNTYPLVQRIAYYFNFKDNRRFICTWNNFPISLPKN